MINGQQLREFYKFPDLVGDIKRRKSEWLENVIRMKQTRVAKNIFESKTIEYKWEGPAVSHGTHQILT
jgi:hypothetical protein